MDYQYFLITVLFVVKTKEMSEKKFTFLLRPIFAIFCRKNILRLLKNRSRTARVDQNDINFVFCIKKVFRVNYARKWFHENKIIENHDKPLYLININQIALILTFHVWW